LSCAGNQGDQEKNEEQADGSRLILSHSGLNFPVYQMNRNNRGGIGVIPMAAVGITPIMAGEDESCRFQDA